MAAVNASWQEAQQAVIGSLLLDAEYAAGEIFQSAKPSWFGNTEFRHVFESARELWLQGKPLDPVTILAAAGNDYEKLLRAAMLATPTAANVGAWLGICRQKARLAAMQAEALAIINTEDEAEAAAAFERIGATLSDTEGIEDRSAGELIGEYLDRMQDQTKPDYLDWGIEKLNTVLGISPGKFVVLGADSSVGKTALALQFAWHMAAQGKKVGFFSLETDMQSLTARLMANRQTAGIPLSVSRNKSLTDADLERAGRAGFMSDWVDLRIIRKADTLEAIRARTLTRRFDVIIIDYVQLIDCPGTERWDIVTRISMGLHRMAQQTGVTIIGLSQITPATKGQKAPTKDDLRESRQLKQDADAILLLSESTDEDDPPHTRVLEVAKNKDGQCGRLKLRFEPDLMTFTPLLTISAMRSEGQAKKNAKPTKPIEVPEKVKAGQLVELPDEENQEVLPF